MLPRFLSTEMTLKSSSLPRSDSRFLTGLTSTSEPGQERLHADVHGEAPLDPVDDAAPDGRAGAVGLLDLVPDLHLLGFVLGKDDVAVLVLGALEEDVHGVPSWTVTLPEKSVNSESGDDPLGLVADVDDHLGRRDRENAPADDLALLEVFERVLVLGQQVLVLLRRQFLFGFHRFGLPTSFIVFTRHGTGTPPHKSLKTRNILCSREPSQPDPFPPCPAASRSRTRPSRSSTIASIGRVPVSTRV